MEKLVVKFKDNDEPKVYDIVTFIKDYSGSKSKPREILVDYVKDMDNHPLVEWTKRVSADIEIGDGNGESVPFESKYEKENIPLPESMATEIVKVATSLKGCTIEFIDKCNEVLDFDLHEKLNGEYGFSGAKRLYSIFKIN